MKRGYPKRCYECGGSVVLKTGEGRTMAYRNIPALEIPSTLAIPTCAACGEEFYNEELTEELEQALSKRYAEEVHRRVVEALDTLAPEVSQQSLENILGLSQGYLSKVRKKKTSPMIASLLLLLADDPQKNVKRLEDAWRAKGARNKRRAQG